MSEIRKALEEALALFDKNHALDHFDWGKSFLNANDIKELNELPGKLREALTLLSPEGEPRGDDEQTTDGIEWALEFADFDWRSRDPGTRNRRFNMALDILAKEVRRLSAEPAPSSEKALGEALRLLERWYTWQAEATEVRMADDDYLNIVTPTAALLASSPAPEEVEP